MNAFSILASEMLSQPEDRSPAPLYGTTAARPVNPAPWTTYGDTDLGLPIFWTGSAWINAIGAPV